MIETANCITETAFDRLMLILVGKEKSGKSRLAATARPPVLFFDFDKRRQALAGMKDVYAMTFIDEQYPKMPTAFNDLCTVLTKIEGGAKIKDLIPGSTDERQPRTLVYDSLASIGKSAMEFVKYSNTGLRRELAIGPMKVYMPKSFDAWSAEMESVWNAVMRAVAMRTKDIILIAHEAAEETPDSSQENRKYTGRVEIYPARYNIFNKHFSEVWRVSRETGTVPKIQVSPDYRFVASSNLDFSKVPQEKLNPPGGPNISQLIELATGK